MITTYPKPSYPKGSNNNTIGPELTPSFDHLQIMHLAMQVEEKLVHVNNFTADSIRNAMHNGTPYRVIIQTLKDQAKDNYVAVAGMIGNSLTDKILEA